MSIVFEHVKTRGIAQVSYLIGDDASGTAAVIDPRPQADVYIEMARNFGVAITHVFETHNHSDFMSGARELVCRASTAEHYVSGEGDLRYGFVANRVKDGDRFSFGSVLLTARHTPGHTREHLSFQIADKNSPRKPWAVFTGDSLLVGSVGCPTPGEGQNGDLATQFFNTLHNYYLKLEDGVIIFPGHCAGAFCDAGISDRPMGTIGYARKTNPFLQCDNLDSFKERLRQLSRPEPHHHKRLKQLNVQGPKPLGCVPSVSALNPKQFKAAVDKGEAQLLDTRQMLAFGGGHISGAINIGPHPELSVWAGQLLDYDRPILLVVEDVSNVNWVVWHCVYSGFTNYAGYLAGGMSAWEEAGLPLTVTPPISVHELKKDLGEFQLLDVRTSFEWNDGHIPGAKHFPVANMHGELDTALELDKQKPIAAYCGTGYRSSIAASLLERNGYACVRNVPGSWRAWKEAGYEVAK